MKTEDMTTRNKIACLILIPMGLPFRGLLVKSPSISRRTLSLSPLPEMPMSLGRGAHRGLMENKMDKGAYGSIQSR